jgi:hypothetical protein
MLQIWKFSLIYNLYYVQCVDQQMQLCSPHMELCHHLAHRAGILTTVIASGRY